MKKIRCVNNRGMEIEFAYEHDLHEFCLVSCDGIYGITNTISTDSNASCDGTFYNGERVDQRNIVITANMRKNYRANRDLLSRVFLLKQGGTFYYEEDGRTRKINYIVESIEIGETGVIRPVTISLLCPEPFFTDSDYVTVHMANWVNDWEFPFEIPEGGMEFSHRHNEIIKTVENVSTKEVGMIVTFEADGIVVNPCIWNMTTNEKMRILRTLNPGEAISINSMEGNIGITLTYKGNTIDCEYCIDEENSYYVMLAVGENVLRYEADSGSEYLNVRIEYENKFMFV